MRTISPEGARRSTRASKAALLSMAPKNGPRAAVVLGCRGTVSRRSEWGTLGSASVLLRQHCNSTCTWQRVEQSNWPRCVWALSAWTNSKLQHDSYTSPQRGYTYEQPIVAQALTRATCSPRTQRTAKHAMRHELLSAVRPGSNPIAALSPDRRIVPRTQGWSQRSLMPHDAGFLKRVLQLSCVHVAQNEISTDPPLQLLYNQERH